MKELSRSRQLAAKVLFAAFEVLKSSGGQLSSKEVLEQVAKNVTFTAWDTERYEKTGYIRWQSILHFYTIGTIKAGFMRKNKGTWYLTKEGEDAIKLGSVGLLQAVNEAYKKWSKLELNNEVKEETGELKDEKQIQKANLSLLEDQALNGLREYLNNKNPYEFQDIVAALLRAMGYFIAFVSPKGRDDGIDIIAYQDPFGTRIPRIKVQVKHKPDTSIPINEVKNLLGSLVKEGEVGLFVTTGNFTSESERFVRSSHIHIDLIDFERFISLWQEYYHKLTDEEKNMLPLKAIYFLGSNE